MFSTMKRTAGTGNRAVEADGEPAARRVSWKRPTSALAALALTLGSVAFGPAPAQAATGQWNQLHSYGMGTGSAIMDSFRHYSSASGRIQLTARSYCVKVQYAPYAIAAVDGAWNNTAWNCSANTTKTLYWSDNFWLAYNGFKFRICTTADCGSVRYIRS